MCCNLGTFYLVRFGDNVGAGIIEFISNIVNITGNPLLDIIIFGIIGVISFSIAFDLVGLIFGSIGKYDSKSMSELHWGIRVFIFAFLTFVLVKIAQFFRWIFTPPQVYFLLGLIALIVLVVVLRLVYNNKKNITDVEKPTEVMVASQPENDVKSSIKVDNQNSNIEDNCPYCGGKLVQRKGPYGNFLGCSNYPECKYTRNKE